MSKLRLYGATSGYVDIEAPAVSPSSTLTLPSPTQGFGKILQVVSVASDTQTAVSTQTYTDAGPSASITPKSSTSKILVITNTMVYAYSSAAWFGIRIMRGDTVVLTPISDGNPYDAGIAAVSGTFPSHTRRHSIVYLDSPNTTSSITYKTQIARYRSTGTVEVNGDAGIETTNGTSTITLFEVSS